MDFRFEDASLDGGVLLHKLGGLFRGNAINGHAAQIARIGLRELPGEGQVALTGHLLDELGIAIHGVAKGGAVRVPVVATVEKDQGILLHFGRVGRSVNGGGVNGPRPVHLCDEATGFDRGIAIREFLCLRERVCNEDKNAAKRSVVQERSGDNEFVFVVELADVGHVLFLELFARFFGELRWIRGTTQEDEKILRGLDVLRGQRSRERGNAEDEREKYGEESFHCVCPPGIIQRVRGFDGTLVYKGDSRYVVGQ